MKKAMIISAILVLLAGVVWALGRNKDVAQSSYRFVEVERGDLEEIVSATGTLSPIVTVKVGTQVSGQISEIFVDFNDHVKNGQLIARIDPILQEQAVRDAEASVSRTEAEVEYLEKEFERNKLLFERQVVTESEFNKIEYNLAVARAGRQSAEVSLARANRNLSYTEIFAPIDGVVIERNVDVGQTVAANFSAPQFFLIANDLSRMEILVSVNESDIGRISEGMEVRFMVQAHPEDVFAGTVHQVRLQSTELENVVNYIVVVGVENPDGKLLPGMTAMVDFMIQTAQDVLMVPNAALRFQPTEQMIAVLEQMRAEKGGDATGGEPGSGMGGGSGMGMGMMGGGSGAIGGERPPNRALLWHLDAEGRITVTPVVTGISDGRTTEIMGPGLEPGMQIIASVTQDAGSSSANPFQSSQSSSRRGPPGSF